MGFQNRVNLDLPKPTPEQWNGEQACQKCGDTIGWSNGVSMCGHVQHFPSLEERTNRVLSDLARCEPGDTLSADLIERAKELVQDVSVEAWARKAYHGR
jgi:hypothetical protein